MSAQPGNAMLAEDARLARPVLGRLEAMQAARGHWLPLWRELAAQIMPRKRPELAARHVLPAGAAGSFGAGDELVFDSTHISVFRMLRA